jgi:Fe-S cluster assembly protein SufB
MHILVKCLAKRHYFAASEYPTVLLGYLLKSKIAALVAVRNARKPISLPAQEFIVSQRSIDEAFSKEYSAGFVTDVESDTLPPGLNEEVVRFISNKKNEPQWLLDWRLQAFAQWSDMPQPQWAHVRFEPVDFQSISYYSSPKSQADGPQSLDDVDPELLRTYEKLGIPLHEREALAGVVKPTAGLAEDPQDGMPVYRSENVAVDAVFDSVSIATTFRSKLAEAGVIFCPISEAVQSHPELVQKYLGSVVPQRDNFYAALNSAVFSDGSFVYIPKGVRCPMELSTYFRINERNTGQFERTLIIADEGAHVSYLEGCTAPMRDENQLHAAVVELVALDDAEIKYSTVQNWYPGDAQGRGGIYNFVTKRGLCAGPRAKISWTQVETGSAITWKYPSVILRGESSVGEFYSVALTNNHQQADTGTKMIHLGRNTKSTIVSKGISAGKSENSYRGLVRISPVADNARNFTQCDSLLIGRQCGAHTFPYVESKNSSAIVEHEASTSKVSDDQLFLCQQRGIDAEKAVSMIVNGFCKEVFRELPMEFAVEAGKLLEVSLEGAVG